MNPLDVIADNADQLTNPRHHTERIWDWDHHRNKRIRRAHITTQPGLLAQLADLAEPSGQTDGEGPRGIPTSRPPLTAAGVALADIHLEVNRWCTSAHLELRATVEANIRALVGHAPHLEHAQQTRLATDTHRWVRRAQVHTGWATPAWQPQAPCPVCGQRKLTIRLDLQVAHCTGRTTDGPCAAHWDAATIGILARHISTHDDASRAAAAAARARHRAAVRNTTAQPA